ncbi:hypothetical protein EDD11_004967 [Mortierella claussenii]|nr:hypothetical protein EDD11_004967 [Mortierella claussenii]
MDTYSKSGGMTRPNKIWSNAVNTLLNAMESILLDEDLRSLWPRKHHGHDLKKKHSLPSTPIIPISHDPTFSPPLKRKKEPLPSSDRSTKSQRMTDHLTARLATSLHVSSSATNSSTNLHQTGMESARGFYRVQGRVESPLDHLTSQDAADNASSEPRKYRKAVRNRSNPTTPVHSHPPSPRGHTHAGGGDDMFSSTPSTSNPFLLSHSPLSGLALESFNNNTASSTLFLDPKTTTRPSSLLMRRENRAIQQPLRPPTYHHLAMATRLALFHRILSTTKSLPTQSKDKDVWIMEQVVKRGFENRQSFEAAMATQTQSLNSALLSLGDGFPKAMHHSSLSSQYNQSRNQEIAIYTTIQQTVDIVLETARWLCGPDFEMAINRICPQWSAHEGSLEQIVHYVQVVESMRETLSGQFQHPHDLAEDLIRSQEVIDYQRTIFGETLRNNGLEWRALGLPAMEELIQKTQDWILNLAKMLTIKIRSEVNFALESALHHRSTADPTGMEMMDEEGDEPVLGRSVSDVMDLVLQGALFSGSSLELAGKSCPMLVTAWMELTSQYCTFALAKRKEQLRKASRTAALSRHHGKTLNIVSTEAASPKQQQQQQQQPHPKMGRGIFLKTMELFENVSRLLQCVMEMREEEEHDGAGQGGRDSLGSSVGSGFGGSGELDDTHLLHGTSAGSSDQDDAMDIVSTSSNSASLQMEQGAYQQPQPRSTMRSHAQQQRRLPMEPTLLQRWIAMESLASVLVETGLELCESMVETLGYGNPTISSSSLDAHSSMASPSLNSDCRLGKFGFLDSISGSFPLLATQPSLTFSTLQDGRMGAVAVPASVRAAAAISSLTSFAGGGAMASGTGGVGLIYVQFVVRLVSKIIEFAGPDSHQEQRLLRVHVSLQNVEYALSAL